MPSITIDGKTCEFDGKKTILQVALENDIEIPHYCYHPGLSIVASCRICLAEVAQPNPRNDNKLEVIPKLLPTCQTPAVDGSEVYTKSPKSIANQKAVMEYLLINHPLDCPVCDQAGECHLQDYSYRYGRAVSRFEEDKIKQPKKDIGPHVLLYADRCIMCTRCVRFTEQVSGTGEIRIFGRGSREQIDIFPGRALENELSGNVVDICPVGALLDKEFLFSQRVWFLKSTPSIDGVTASGDNIWIEHNEGQVYRLKPRTNMEVNRWWISDEIRYGWRFVHSEERLRTPMRHQLGEQLECDWNRAYKQVRDELRKILNESGPGTLGLMVSPMLSCEEAYLLGQLARGLDEQAVLAIGPVPCEGQDKSFPGGYTIHAEKCPNRRGVKRALQLVHDQTGGGPDMMDYDGFQAALADRKSPIKAVLLTGNYTSPWTTPEFVKALGKRHLTLIDTLPNDLTAKADVLLPGATWAEKAGTFENATSRLQTFDQAIAVIELAKPEGQIALDLLAICGLGENWRYDAAMVRAEMGGAFVEHVHLPLKHEKAQTEMEFVRV